jgi:uncharacterized repeat protein (TIGR01451 family)
MKFTPRPRPAAIEILESRIAPAVDLALTLAHAPEPAVAGANLTYTVHFQNDGDSAATNVMLADTLPPGCTFVSLSGPSGWALTMPPVGNPGSILATKASVAANEHGDFTLVVHLNPNIASGSAISDTATITSGSSETNTANNSGTITASVLAVADLSVVSSDSPDPAGPGMLIIYSFTVTNNGPSDAQNVTLTERYPTETSPSAFAQLSGPSFSLGFNGTEFTATITTLAAGASATFQASVVVLPNTPATSIVNSATITANTADSNPGNNFDFETTGIQRAFAFGLDVTNNLLRFDTTVPGTILSSTPITGLQAGENILGMDFRPGAGGHRELYAIGSTSRLYTIDTTTGAASLVAALAADPTDTTNPFTSLSGAQFGVDFNPVSDRLRVVSASGQNLRINVTNGLVITDADLNPGTPSVVGAAYTNDFAGATATTLYDIDSGTNQLLIQNPPNNGTLTGVGVGLGVNVQGALGFDIRSNNQALAVMTTDGVSSALYSIDLTTGTATLIGSVGTGGMLVRSMAIAPEGFVATLSGDTATFVGGYTDDALVIDQSGGLLRHNRFDVDPGFNSPFDFDSTIAGDQTLSATTATHIVVNGGDGNDTVIVGTASTAAEQLAADVEFHGGNGTDGFVYQNSSGDAEKHSYKLSSDKLLRDGTSIVSFDNDLEKLTIAAGAGNDTIKESGFRGFAIIDAGSGKNKVSGGDAVVSGKTFSFTDTDGDRAKLSVSKGELSLSDLNFVFNATTTGLQLQSLDLFDDGTEFAGANITLTASKKSGGDGMVHLGLLNSGGNNLGKVTIKGDLGKILAGDLSPSAVSVASLSTHSIGLFGLVTQGGVGDLSSLINESLGPLKVTGDFSEARFQIGNVVGGNIKSISIGGDFIGGTAPFAGSITTSGAVGPVSIGGDLFGGTATFTAYLQAQSFGKFAVGGDVQGGSGAFSGRVQCNGDCGPVSVRGDVTGGTDAFSGSIAILGALARLQIGGSLIGGMSPFSGGVSSSLDMGDVRIGGDLKGGTASSTGLVMSNSAIGNVQISGSLIAQSDTATRSGIFAGDDIGKVKIGGSVLGLGSNPILIVARGQDAKPATGFDTAIASLTVNGDVRSALILAGFTASLIPNNADASIGAVVVGGSWKASSLVAGAQDTGATGFGVGDTLQATNNTSLTARIASITIKGEVTGSFDSTDNFGFVAQQIDKVKIQGRSIPLTTGPSNDNILVAFTDDVHILEV